MLISLIACAPFAKAQIGAKVPVGGGAKPIPKPTVAEAEEEVLRIDVEYVNVFFVAQQGKQFVGGLTKNDFEVFEDGVKQDIERFDLATDLPLTIGLLIDVSGSQERLIQSEQVGASAFLQKVLKDKDLAFLLSFGPYTEMLQDLTNSKKLLNDALGKLKMIQPAVGINGSTIPGQQVAGTVLYDAVYVAAEDVLKAEAGRKVIIIISDGVDTGSKVSSDGAVKSALSADSIIYGINYVDPAEMGGGFRNVGIGGPIYTGSAMGSGLGKLSSETGGRTYDAGRDLNRVFDEIQNDMRSQYFLAYKPKNENRNGAFRKIEIRSKKKGIKARARKGYFAPTS
jgi:VWFA-related protein